MTTIIKTKLARVQHHAVLVGSRQEGRDLASMASKLYRRTFYVLQDDYNKLLRVSPNPGNKWNDELLFSVEAPRLVRVDPAAAAARRQDGQHYDQRALHRGKVRANEWRRQHGLS